MSSQRTTLRLRTVTRLLWSYQYLFSNNFITYLYMCYAGVLNGAWCRSWCSLDGVDNIGCDLLRDRKYTSVLGMVKKQLHDDQPP